MIQGDFRYGTEQLEIASDYVYLGVNFKPSGSFTAACQRMADQARKALFKIRSMCHDGPISVALTLFDCLVVPVLQYGFEVWAPGLFKDLNDSNFKIICDRFLGESLAKKFYRGILGVNRFSSDDAVRGELGRYPILIRCLVLAIKYFETRWRDPHSGLMLAVLEESRELSGGWVKQIVGVLNKFGINFEGIDVGIFPNQACGRKISTIIEKESKLRYQHQWRELINNQDPKHGKPKLRTYCRIKDSFHLEPYLLSGDLKARKMWTRFRISSHKLGIEAGRHHKPRPIPIEERLCTKCNTGDIEDEYHFLMTCPAFQTIRTNFWDRINEFADTGDWSEGFRFKFILGGGLEDWEFIHIINKYMKDMWEARFDE